MLIDRDEQLIQRALDGELAGDQRRELLRRMDVCPDGWKRLACSFMEDRLLRTALTTRESGRPDQDDDSGNGAVVPASRKHRNSDLSRYPTLSVAVTVLMAFGLGLLIPWGRSSGSNDLVVTVPDAPVNPTIRSQVAPPVPDASGAGTFQYIEYQLPDGRQIFVPVQDLLMTPDMQ